MVTTDRYTYVVNIQDQSYRWSQLLKQGASTPEPTLSLHHQWYGLMRVLPIPYAVLLCCGVRRGLWHDILFAVQVKKNKLKFCWTPKERCIVEAQICCQYFVGILKVTAILIENMKWLDLESYATSDLHFSCNLISKVEFCFTTDKIYII